MTADPNKGHRSNRFLSRVGAIQIQAMLQAIGVWVQLGATAYSAGVR